MKLLTLATAVLSLAATSPAQTFTVLHNFDYRIDGKRPEAGLVLGSNTLYGTTTDFGSGNGRIFKVSTDGSGFAVLHSSTNADWLHPNGLILNGGTLYGTTQYGDNGSGLWIGTVFKIDTHGSNYTVLKTFNGADGKDPMAGLVLDGETLYGTTAGGGASDGGTVFKVKTDGSGFAVLHSFAWQLGTNNGEPGHPFAELTLNGSTLYGTTLDGGSGVFGTVFKLNTDGSEFAVLHNFSNSSTNGAQPRARLLLSGDTLYGTTSGGGSWGGGTVFKVNTNGSDFALLHSFAASPSGPWAGLILSGNTLYGASPNAGTGLGILFKLNTDGSSFALLHNFPPDSPTNLDGALPYGSLVLSDNTLFGTAAIDGNGRGGTVFSLQLLEPPTPPVISSATQTNGTFAFTWNASPGSSYQVQYKTDVASSNWTDLGNVLVATNSTLCAADFIGPDAQRFYRVVLLVP